MENKCLLIKTSNNRKFLTHENNLNSLIEFAKTFNAEIHLVECENKKDVMDLKSLISSICEAEEIKTPNYKIIKRIFPEIKDLDLVASPKNIRLFISEKLLSAENVSFTDLTEKFKDVKDSCLNGNMCAVKKDLKNQGYELMKISAGCYSLKK